MAIIDPDGLFSGDRLAALSDKARLYWPWLYSATNGYARMELNPRAIIRRCFPAFSEPMTEAQLLIILSEYAENYLLFVYEADGQQWIQFDTPSKLLPRHKTKRDDASPNPTPASRAIFDKGYLAWKRSKSFSLHQSRENLELFREDARGIGIGVGVGGGVGVGVVATPTDPAPPENTPQLSKASSVSAILDSPPANPDIETLVQRILLAHPRSLMRKTRWGEPTYAHRVAVLRAMEREMEAQSLSAVDALEVILAETEQYASGIPPDRFQFVPDIEKFFMQHEYRVDPVHLNREDRNAGNQSNQTRRPDAVERQRASRDAIAEAGRRRYGAGVTAADVPGAGIQAQPDAAPGDAGHVPPGMGGTGATVRHGAISGRVVEGAPPVTILPSA